VCIYYICVRCVRCVMPGNVRVTVLPVCVCVCIHVYILCVYKYMCICVCCVMSGNVCVTLLPVCVFVCCCLPPVPALAFCVAWSGRAKERSISTRTAQLDLRPCPLHIWVVPPTLLCIIQTNARDDMVIIE